MTFKAITGHICDDGLEVRLRPGSPLFLGSPPSSGCSSPGDCGGYTSGLILPTSFFTSGQRGDMVEKHTNLGDRKNDETPNSHPVSMERPQNQSMLPEFYPISHSSFPEELLDWFFPRATVVLEMLFQVFNLISSKKRPDLGLVATAMSFATLLVCIIELIQRGCKEKVAWRKWKWGMIYWFLHPNDSPFGTLSDVTGLICSILQCVFASIAYGHFCNHEDDPFELLVRPIAYGFLFLKLRQITSETVTEP